MSPFSDAARQLEAKREALREARREFEAKKTEALGTIDNIKALMQLTALAEPGEGHGLNGCDCIIGQFLLLQRIDIQPCEEKEEEAVRKLATCLPVYTPNEFT
jgi:hypothetical protein